MALISSTARVNGRPERVPRHRPWVRIATHAVLVTLAYLAAFLLRFDSEFDSFRAWQFLVTLPVLLPVRLAVFWQFGMFRLYWRHAGFRDVFGLI